MIRINQIKLNLAEDESKLPSIIGKKLKIKPTDIIEYKIIKKSIDARKKNEIKLVYAVNVIVEKEEQILKRVNDNNVMLTNKENYSFTPSGSKLLSHRPVIVGTGPAGLFCAYMLAKHGFRPIVIERGEDVDSRIKSVNAFWNNQTLNANSNVQFGEGGAGTFSDGKLNTLINDKLGRNQVVLETFVEFGAPENILYDSKPHIGTDILCNVIKNIRNAIISLGGEVRFNQTLTDIHIKDGSIHEIEINGEEILSCEILILALGHSARDTFEMLYQRKLSIEPKAFAVGIRVEHPQTMINISQYGMKSHSKLGAANYKLAATASNGRSVYSFCMCPGGYVVNASSEEGHLAVNGMSYHQRDSRNANSAIVVSVTPKDFNDPSPLGGIAYQRDLEQRAYQCGNGNIPVQLYGDFIKNCVSQKFGSFEPCVKGTFTFGNLKKVLPMEICAALEEAIHKFGRVIKGFDNEDTIMLGIESRTSSPIRINRDEAYQSNITGVYPCGEGAGYAGGISSAAMDGIKVFEAVASYYSQLDSGCE